MLHKIGQVIAGEPCYSQAKAVEAIPSSDCHEKTALDVLARPGV
jgi:hypothetical protein